MSEYETEIGVLQERDKEVNEGIWKLFVLLQGRRNLGVFERVP